VKTTPHIEQGKVTSLALGTVKLLHQKNKRRINGDQEGCMLDLKPAPDER